MSGVLCGYWSYLPLIVYEPGTSVGPSTEMVTTSLCQTTGFTLTCVLLFILTHRLGFRQGVSMMLMANLTGILLLVVGLFLMDATTGSPSMRLLQSTCLWLGTAFPTGATLGWFATSRQE